MKRITCVVLVLVFLFAITGCGKDTANGKDFLYSSQADSIEPWSEEDLAFYDSNGESVNVTQDTLLLSSINNGRTNRGIMLGTDATEIISKYDLFYGLSAYTCNGDTQRLADESALKAMIDSKQEIIVMAILDSNYQGMDVIEYVRANNPEAPYAGIQFYIDQGVVTDVCIAKP